MYRFDCWTIRSLGRLVAAVGISFLFFTNAAFAAEDPDLVIDGMMVRGVRRDVTTSWGQVEFDVINRSTDARTFRLLTQYQGQTNLQYGRDLWMPGQSKLASWLTIGPVTNADDKTKTVEIQSLLYDQTNAADKTLGTLVRTTENEISKTILAPYSPPRTSVALIHDALIENDVNLLKTEFENSIEDRSEVLTFLKVVRHEQSKSQDVSFIRNRLLPSTVESYDGVEYVLLASNRVVEDIAGMRALRTWVEQGGRLWIMLDKVSSETVAALLGDLHDFEIVDQTSLTSIKFQEGPSNPYRAPEEAHVIDHPVDFVRVLLNSGEPLYTVNGWPASFNIPLGRGSVMFTTLEGPGWFRKRTEQDGKSRFSNDAYMPVALSPLRRVAFSWMPRPEPSAFEPAALQPFLEEEIGYQIIKRDQVIQLLGGFCAGLAILAILLYFMRKTEHLGWIGPIAAVVIAAFFVQFGVSARSSVPTSVAMTQIVDAVAGSNDAQISGLVAVYTPEGSQQDLIIEGGGQFEPDRRGMSGQTHRMIRTDLDDYHWENVNSPAGIRTTSFKKAFQLETPLEAVAEYGADGITGQINSKDFTEFNDAMLLTPQVRRMAISFSEDSQFQTGSTDVMGPTQFLASELLSDMQRRRQDMYQQFLAHPLPRHLENREVLLAWSNPMPLNFGLADGAQTGGSSLLILPIQFRQTPPNTQVVVPGPMIGYQNMVNDTEDAESVPTYSNRSHEWVPVSSPADTHLRFQLPRSVVPMDVGSCLLTMKVNAPSRLLRVLSGAGEKQVVLAEKNNALGTIQLPIDQAEHLQLDDMGGLHLILSVGETTQTQTSENRISWNVDYLELEVRGQTRPEESR